MIETDKYIGIVMEHASGGELFDYILAHKYLRERDASKLFAQLMSGVWYCHQKKIVHRDLKLDTVLLDRNRNVIITDFCSSNYFGNRIDDLMQTSCGSPYYAAPELVISEGLYVGSAVDVWSCGVILYAMLAGYLPFDDDPNNPDGDDINLLYRYIVGTPLTFPDHVSAEARDLLSIMLVPDPKYRATLEHVMAHSWLSAFQPLFRQSVRDLERAAQAQQQEKRQQYWGRMRERTEQQQRAANRQGANGPSTPPSRTQSTSEPVTAALVAHQILEHRDTARVRPGTTFDARAPVVEDTTPSNSTVTISASNIPKLPLTAPSELNVITSASDIPTRPKPSTTPSEPTATASASDILKYPEPGTLSLESASTTLVSDIPHDLKPGTLPSELPVILSAPDIPKNPIAGISSPESTGTFVSNVPTTRGPGSLGSEATLTYLAPDENTNLKGHTIPSRFSEVCGLEGRSIHSLRGNEAAEIGNKLHAVRSYLHSSSMRDSLNLFVVSQKLLVKSDRVYSFAQAAPGSLFNLRGDPLLFLPQRCDR